MLDLDEQIRQWLELQRGQWQAIADAAGVSHSWLSKFARGLIPNPGYVTLRRLERCRMEGGAVDTLREASDARLRHADALQAWGAGCARRTRRTARGRS